MKRTTRSSVRGLTLIDLVIVLVLIFLFVYLGFVTYTNIVANREQSKVSDVSDMLDAPLNTAQTHLSDIVSWHRTIAA